MNPNTPASLRLSPTLNHRFVLEHTQASLGYRGGDVRAWQEKLRPQMRRLLGLDDIEASPRLPLNPRTLWRREHELGTIEQITFTGEAESDILAYLCLPREPRTPRTTMICLQGHSTGAHVSIAVQRDDETQPYQVEGDRDFGLECMRRGVVALCIEQRSFGQRREQTQEQRFSHPCSDAAFQAIMLGRTLAGERVFDVDRGLDYLATRSDVDIARVGVMGNSGGGTVSMYAAAVLPRLAFAMPSCSFCTFADSIMAISHCADNYVPGILKYAEAADVLGLFAPSPLVIVSGETDPIFPIIPARKEFSRLEEIYAAAGAPGYCRHVVGNGGHRFYAADAWPVLLELVDSL
jgi:dienelactone hydrolase